jgi:hypothetical protein
MGSMGMEPLTEVSSLFGQVETFGGQLLNTTVPVEFAGLSRDSKDAKKGSAGFQRLGGVLLILTGIIAAYTSSQELVELIRTQKSEAVELLKDKAKDIEANLRPIDFLRD